MITTDYICCKACDEKYFLRVGVGLENYQLHSFDCKSCGIPISIAVRVIDPPNVHIEGVENVVFLNITDTSINYIEEEGITINLHPFFAFDQDEIHERFAFPSIIYTRMIMGHIRRLPNSKFIDIESQFNIPNASNLWKTVKNIISLEENNKERKIITKQINYYKKQRLKYMLDVQASTAKDVETNFLDNLFYPRINELVEPAFDFISQIKIDETNKFRDFLDFYHKDIRHQHLTQYLMIFSDYFKIYSQLSQIVVHARISDEDVDDRIVGSKCFEDVKLYYGQAYEVLTGLFVIFACLNNIYAGRAYDQFEKMTLNKYIKDVKKEKKANPFIKIKQFSAFTDGLDSTLRNGSHHASIWRDNEKVFYRSGGTGMQREMPYSRYLHLCNKLTISLAAMFWIELELRNL